MRDYKHTEAVAITVLRSLLGVLFLWLGLLKLASFGPAAMGLDTLPYFGVTGTQMPFGLLEAVIGLLLLVNVLLTTTELLLLVYMLGAALVLAAVPELAFTQGFPQLSTLGELILKNLALGIAGISLLVHEKRQQFIRTHDKQPTE